MDTWVVLANDERRGRHHRGLYVLKSRGMAHSNELRRFELTDHGFDVFDAADHERDTLNVRRAAKGLTRHAAL
jgi:hypothetical protein